VGIEKAVIDRTDRLIPLTCMEVEDENDDEDENDSVPALVTSHLSLVDTAAL
jgi:hypothetical protein